MSDLQTRRDLLHRERADLAPAGDEGAVMSFGDHIEELRRRLLFGLLGAVPIFALAVYYGQSILEFLVLPVQNALRHEGQRPTLQATNVLETFFSYFKIAGIVTLLLAGPWLLWQLWKFVAPGLYQHERRFAYLLVPMSALLTILGIVFLYFIILPAMLKFFVHFGSEMGRPVTPIIGALPEGVTLPVYPVLEGDPKDPAVGAVWINRLLNELRCNVALPGQPPVIMGMPLTKGAGIEQQYRIKEYLDLFLSMMLAFAGGFQTPVLVMLLGWAGVIDRAMLKHYRKHVVLICAVAAAILTPTPDPLTMSLLAIPLYLLFELGGFLLWALPADRVARGLRPKKEGDVDAGD
ncbi:MAG: twin-arginine translocase subunit TatC [Phycisphaerales bacterium]|nr:twin-arginine translocase subunit TatC [Phycisphaerales bacterium]